MTKTYTGGCACGAIRYETSSEPIFENHCQCRDCQKRSGTGHGSYLTFPRRADVTIAGEANTWRVAGDSGNEKVHAFCPTCGTPVYLTFVAMPELIAVNATSLDDPGQFNPQVVTYSISGHAWDTMNSSLQNFERMPPGISSAGSKYARCGRVCCRSCPTCGTPVCLTFLAMPELTAVQATSLDDPSQFNPQMVPHGICGRHP